METHTGNGVGRLRQRLPTRPEALKFKLAKSKSLLEVARLDGQLSQAAVPLKAVRVNNNAPPLYLPAESVRMPVACGTLKVVLLGDKLLVQVGAERLRPIELVLLNNRVRTYQHGLRRPLSGPPPVNSLYVQKEDERQQYHEALRPCKVLHLNKILPAR